MAASTCDKSFCSNYMLLKPEETAGFLEICKILFSSEIGKTKLVDCPDGIREPKFGRRWIIFISLLMMKSLQAVAKPLAGFGSGIEHWLNLLSENGGFLHLLLNFFKGEVIYRDETSARFLSFIGNIDKRKELDWSMRPGDERYYAGLSVMAAKASYENNNYIESLVRDHWKMNFLGFYNLWNDYQEKATTQAFILQEKKDNTIVVAFRGTEPFDADSWSSDLDLSWYELPGIGKIHGGFMKALGLQISRGWPQNQADDKPETAYYAIRKLLKQNLNKNENVKFIITGHSLGGALAALFPAVLALHEESALLERIEGIYTFGQPRIGDERFGEFMKKVMKKYDLKYLRFVYSYDLVPRLPYDDSMFMFKHFGDCIYYNSFYRGRVVAEEPVKNYFSLKWVLPKLINACWELIRSILISYRKGSEYEEGGLLRLIRLIGIVMAGMPAHCPQDYVNSIRLGSSKVFSSVPNSNDQKIMKMQ